MSMESDSEQQRDDINSEVLRPYVFHEHEAGKTHVSPFTVTVSGLGNEFFGTGRVIGQIKGNPVIEVVDCINEQPYLIMGYESWWTPGTVQEVLDKVQSGELHTDSVADYRRSLDERDRLAKAEDEAFLLKSGIDPNL